MEIKEGERRSKEGPQLKRIIDMEIVANQTIQKAIEKHNRQ
jgi:hypothetical protein